MPYPTAPDTGLPVKAPVRTAIKGAEYAEP